MVELLTTQTGWDSSGWRGCGVSNPLALPWAKPWLQLVWCWAMVDQTKLTVGKDAGNTFETSWNSPKLQHPACEHVFETCQTGCRSTEARFTVRSLNALEAAIRRRGQRRQVAWLQGSVAVRLHGVGRTGFVVLPSSCFCNKWLKKWLPAVLSALWMNGTIGGKLRYWFNMLGYWIVVGSWFCNRWRKKWSSLCGMRNVNHPRRSKCMVSAALAAWIVLGSWFCNRWLKKWLQSRGVSNAL